MWNFSLKLFSLIYFYHCLPKATWLLLLNSLESCSCFTTKVFQWMDFDLRGTRRFFFNWKHLLNVDATRWEFSDWLLKLWQNCCYWLHRTFSKIKQHLQRCLSSIAFIWIQTDGKPYVVLVDMSGMVEFGKTRIDSRKKCTVECKPYTRRKHGDSSCCSMLIVQ